MAANAVRQAARSFRLAVLNLPWTVGTKELSRHFKQYGPVSYCNVVFDHNTGFSKGFGFVQFADEGSFNEAHNAVHMIDGEKVKVDIPNQKSGQMRGRRSAGARITNINKLIGDITMPK